MRTSILLFLLLFFISGCKKDTDATPDKSGLRYAPTRVVVQMRNNSSMEKAFDLINKYEAKVTYLYNIDYTSSLPADSLQYILDALNTKSYINNSEWRAGGYVHYETQRIHIFPRLFGMENKDYQKDWLNNVRIFKLSEIKKSQELGNCFILFSVPAGKEMEWVRRFRNDPAVKSAEPDYYADISPF